MYKLDLKQIQLLMILVLLFFWVTINEVKGDPIIFPGAQGFGSDSRGAYGAANDPIICIVTNLSTSSAALTNSLRNGVPVLEGSLRSCINHTPPADTGKIILFEVSGTIRATSHPWYYSVDNQYTSIYGQTAPSPGITLRNVTISVKGSDVLIQHLRFRNGDEPGLTPSHRDGFYVFSGDNSVNNAVIDHCSVSWGVDETLSIYDQGAGSITNVTISNSIISEGLEESIHAEGPHSKGLLVSGNTGSAPSNIALLRNIITGNKGRTPYIQNASNVVIANNLFYNNGLFNIFLVPITEATSINITNNAGIGGPLTSSHARQEILTLWDIFYDNGTGSEVYLVGNRAGENNGGSIVWNNIQSDPSDWTIVDNRFDLDTGPFKKTSPTVTIPGAAYIDSADLVNVLEAAAGARPADRDSVDIRLMAQLLDGSGSSYVDSISMNNADCVGLDDPMWCCEGPGTGHCTRNPEAGWPVLAENTINHFDMPADPHNDTDGDGYTNLEEWIHVFSAQVEGRGENLAPIVNAGTDQSITLPVNTVNLNGTVSDDGQPNPPGSVTTLWTEVSGPSMVFGNEYDVDTSAVFSVADTYVLRLTADDSDLQTSDDIIITVNPDTVSPARPTGLHIIE